MLNDYLEKELNSLEANGLKRKMKITSSTQGSRIVVDGKEVLNFCSNNYLGLADDFRLCKAAIDEIEKSGFGSGASRLICGNMTAHRRLEERIARFKGAENCLVFSSGYMANVGIISSLFNREDVIYSDRLNHASIVDGILLSRAKLKRYKHCDMDSLEEMLKQEGPFKKKCIITDSVFSMDGDIAPLDKICELAKKYDCSVMIDEAHAFGVMGEKGEGLAKHFGVEQEIDVQMGTLSKAVGSFGAYCCGSNKLISLLINKARSFIYTTAMPPMIAAASIKAIDIIEENSKLRKLLWDNTKYVNEALKRIGLDTMNTQTPIIPVLLKSSKLAVDFSERLFDAGIYISAIRPPTVEKNMARLRLTVMATHRKEDLDHLIQQIKTIAADLL
ncbi:MAG: 8-amino-7-oxononanoate synthase [Candidatus Omnitrophica bacterium]|nr:8-amino-7-oxononanoate synthase [Candidatus Omnitrophota bacterium]MBU1996044.1 8-amino-7-oxononanoate synthase [Candidatus Omnitrophota bacterium]MBU4334045.1 8-amino-7-oxononanoate synthase [Candidatus Omnitrophota bacterium]